MHITLKYHLMLTVVDVAFSQLDDGAIPAQQTTPVHSLFVVWLQHFHSEGAHILGHLQFPSIHQVFTVTEGEAGAALGRVLLTPNPQKALVLHFIRTCQLLPKQCLTGTCTVTLFRCGNNF